MEKLGGASAARVHKRECRRADDSRERTPQGLWRALLKSELSTAHHIHLKKSPYSGEGSTGKDKGEQRTLLGDCTQLKIFPVLTIQSR